MIKTGHIEIGKTPSSVSGKPADHLDNEEPVAAQEKAASVRELNINLDTPDEPCKTKKPI